MRILILFLTFILSEAIAGPKNVIILFPEDMGNHLGLLNTTGIKTPNLDQLARDGVYFKNAFCGQPVCSPSKGAIYTGRLPHDNGLTRNVLNYSVEDLPITDEKKSSNYKKSFVREEVPTLVEILKNHKVFTAITHKTHVQPMKKFPFDLGWGKNHGKKNVFKASNWEETISLIKNKSKNRPFFLMANTPLTHAPWKRKLVENGISTNPEDRLAPPTTVDWREIPIHPFLPDTPAARKDLARYFAMVQLVDDWVKVMLENLKKEGLEEDTLVIFTPDHGMAYQRGKTACYPAGTQIPLIIKGPGVKENVSISAPVSHVDLMSTILEFLDLDLPSGMHGHSLWPMLRGEVKEFKDRKTIMTETNIYYQARAVTDGRWYYIRNFTQPKSFNEDIDPWLSPPMNVDQWMPDHSHYDNQVYSETIRVKQTQPVPYQLLSDFVQGQLPSEELFDLHSDPWAIQNLAKKPQHKNELSRMRQELSAWLIKTNDKYRLNK